MKKLIVILSTVVLSLSCLFFTSAASAKASIVIGNGHHRYPAWNHHHPKRYPHWQRHHRHPRYHR